MEGTMNTLYQDLVLLGVPIDSHESDLYVVASPEVSALIEKHGLCKTTFRHEVLKTIWYDVPFAFDPWWEVRRPR
jgi:hypothetical protein